MYYNLIKNYISKISKEDIQNFATKQEVILTNYEIDIIYINIKDNWEKIYNGNEEIFNNIKNEVREEVYNKIILLYNEFKEKLL